MAWGSLNTAAALKKIAGMTPSSTQAGTPKTHFWFSHTQYQLHVVGYIHMQMGDAPLLC